jgi:phosphoribosylformylglycinamidine cyclo-ligase
MRAAYREAGVDVEAGERAVDLMRGRVESTFGPEVLTGLGSFAAAVGLPAGYREPVLVSATDGVGTKSALAVELGRYDTIGIDLVAMCADDVVCLGARPLFFLDYIAVEHLDGAVVASIVEGVAAGCRLAGCALVGGETAEHPGRMPEGAFDLAGFCIGIAERADLFAEPAGRPGDVLIGLAANGLHSNGFSLVRRLIADGRLELTDELLAPTRIYAPDVLALRDQLTARGLALRGLAHITGGGLPGNIPRALSDGAAARVDPSRWPVPRLQARLADLAGLDPVEARAIWNMGIGMVSVVEPAAAQLSVDFLLSRGIEARQIGDVVAERDAGRYFEEPLP